MIGTPPTVSLSPQSSWGGASLASLKDVLEKEVFKGAIHPRPKGRGFTPP